MANNDKENKIKKFTKEAIGKTLNQFNKEIGIADLVEINKNQDRILNGILSQVNDENTEKTEKSNIITLDNSTDGIVELKEIQGDTNVNVSKIEEMPITHDIGDKEGNVFTLNEIPKGAISIGEIQGNTMVNCNKDDKKELVLMKDLSTQGDNSITLTEGVDGGKVDVALEGNTLVNVSKTKESTAITKAYTVENSGNHIALQGDIDGSCRPVITGNTLVNIAKGSIAPPMETTQDGFDSVEIIEHDNYVTYKMINASKVLSVFRVNWSLQLQQDLVEGKTYTAILPIPLNTHNGHFRIRDNKTPVNYTSPNGTTCWSFTATANGNGKYAFYAYTTSDYSVGDTVIFNMPKKIIILEGDWVDKPIPDYFTGLQSSFEDNLITQEMVDNGEELAENLGKYKVDYVVTGKNKFDATKGFDCVYGSKAICMRVSPGKTYTYSSSPYTGGICIGFYREYSTLEPTNNKISSILISYRDIKSRDSFIIPNECEYIWFNYNRESNIQIEEGSVATPYEPYKEYKKTFYLNSPLLEGDTIEEKDGSIYHVHRYKKSNISSDFKWYKNDKFFYSNNDSRVFYSKDNMVYCDKIPKVHYQKLDALSSYGISLIGRFRVNLSNMNAQNNTLEEFKQWLTDNNPTVVYELKTPTYELIEQSNLAIPSYSNGHLDLTSAVPISKVNFLHFEEDLTYLYPSTSYTIQFISDKAITVDMNLGGTELLAKNVVVGLNRISITTPDTLANNKLVIDGVGAKISEVVVTDTDREFMYFEGMKSVGECEDNGIEILSNNKNLADFTYEKGNGCKSIEPIDGGFIATFNGTMHNNVRVNLSDNIIKLNSKFNLVLSYDVEVLEPTDFDITSSDYTGYASGCASYPLVSNNHTAYLAKNITRFNLHNSANDNNITKMKFYNIQISLNKSTDYIPHQSNIQQLTHEPLRRTGAVKDRYVMIDGKWFVERNCGGYTFTGNENWKTDASSENIQAFITDSVPNVRLSSTNIISNIYPKKQLRWSTNELGFDTGSGSNFLMIYLLKSDASTIEELRNYLSNNEISIVYELQTPVYEPIDYNPLEVYADVTHITTNSAVPTNITIKNHGFNCLLKPSTTYTVSSSRGINTVTTGADIGDSCLRFYNEDTSNVTTMKDVLVLEGDWTSKANLIPSNFSGIKSVFEQELVTDENNEYFGKYKVVAKIIGKNLFDESSAKVGYYWRGDNILATVENSIASEKYLKVVPGMILLANNQSSSVQYMEYDSNKEFIQRVNKAGGTTYKVPNNVAYLRFSFYASNNTNFQIEQVANECVNSLAQITPHEPYKESSVTFYIDEPLRCVEDSKDRVFIQDDKVIVERNCGGAIFDGSNDEGWAVSGNPPMSNSLSEFTKKFSECKVLTNLISNDFSMQQENAEGFKNTSAVYNLRLFINKVKLQTQDIEGFKQWLQQNPTTIVYQLAEPTYEEVEFSSNRLILNTFNNESFNNSTLFLDTNILPKLSFKPLYEELVYVKNSTKYYIQFNAVGSGEVVINLGGTELTTEIVEGYNCIPITTPSESTNLMTIIGQGITISEVVVSEVICGGYYKGLQSCFEEHMENGKYRVLLRGIALDGSKVNGIKLYINEPLRGVNDTKDRLCIKNGKLMVERKCGEFVFDGSNYIPKSMDTSIDTKKRWLIYQNSSIKDVSDSQVTTINDKYCDISANDTWYNKEGISQNSMQHAIHIYLERYSDGSDESKQALISELQQNPITVVYELAEPVYEEATNEYGLPIVFEGYENGIVYIDSSVTPTTHIKYTSNNQLATTLSEAEEQNITTQEDINMNVITYMMDIDMMLTDMEMSNDISVMAVRRDNSNENMLDRMSDEDKKVYRDNTVVMLEKMITAKVLDKEDIERRINMYYDKNRISKEQYEYLKSLL